VEHAFARRDVPGRGAAVGREREEIAIEREGSDWAGEPAGETAGAGVDMSAERSRTSGRPRMALAEGSQQPSRSMWLKRSGETERRLASIVSGKARQAGQMRWYSVPTPVKDLAYSMYSVRSFRWMQILGMGIIFDGGAAQSRSAIRILPRISA
jgi:hypothetical protein